MLPNLIPFGGDLCDSDIRVEATRGIKKFRHRSLCQNGKGDLPDILKYSRCRYFFYVFICGEFCIVHSLKKH